MISASIASFPNNNLNQSQSLRDSIYRALAWGGLHDTDVFLALPNRCDILAINVAARDTSLHTPFIPNAPASMPPCANTYYLTADSLKLRPACQ
jgi:hypothetical protein